MLVLLLDNNMSLHSQRVQVLIAKKHRISRGARDTAREVDELTAGFLACFYPVRQLSVGGAPIA